MTKRFYLKMISVLACLMLFIGIIYLIFQRSDSIVDLPIKFDSYQIPVVNVTIEDKKIELLVDLGAKNELYLSSQLLHLVNKNYSHMETWKNIKGESFQRRVFALSEMTLGTHSFSKIMAVERCHGDDNATIVSGDKKTTDIELSKGILGRGFLKKINLLLDFQDSRLILTKNSLWSLKKYNANDFHKVPFEMSEKGLIVKIGTDLGRLSFAIDTGSTMTLLRNREGLLDKKLINSRYGLPMLKTTNFIMNGLDYGDSELHCIQMTSELEEIDGILGMDFLRKFVMFIDFKKNFLYLKRV